MALTRLIPGVALMLALAGTGCAQSVSVVTTNSSDTAAADHERSEAGAAISARLADVMDHGAASGDAFRSAAVEAGLRTDGHGVLVDALTRGLQAGDRGRFAVPGASVVSFSAKYQRVTVSAATPAVVRRIAQISVVRRVEAAVGATTFGISD